MLMIGNNFTNVANATNNSMENEKAKQGEILMLLVHRSGFTGKEAAEKLNIHPSHLSKLFRSEFISEKMRRKACDVFSVPYEVWRNPEMVEDVRTLQEPAAEYRSAADLLLDRLDRIEQMLGEMQGWQGERLRLLGIIEHITGASAHK